LLQNVSFDQAAPLNPTSFSYGMNGFVPGATTLFHTDRGHYVAVGNLEIVGTTVQFDWAVYPI